MSRSSWVFVIALGVAAGAVLIRLLTTEPYELAVKTANDAGVAERLGRPKVRLLVRGPVFVRDGDETLVRLIIFGEKGVGTLRTSVVREHDCYFVSRAELDGVPIKMTTAPKAN